ncbi:uncharacterized protein LOC108909499 [Anoplophora glabripennis]|uniref:uncharacterized protein LOC108909499 n=1 Tax=Anoplophora glabripennis TaxID=217634 RepID=UPI00087510B2|nr:uncharacterized protein LOC108909499 [Anoplophora glabripennis]
MTVISKICVQLQFLFVVLLLFISTGSCLQCYKCFSTNRDCYGGNPRYLGILNCSSKHEVCATFQYQIDDSSASYVTTIRGCQPITKDGICSQLMKTKSNKNVVQKGILCETCNTDLCNSCTIKSVSFFTLPIAILLIILKI